VLTGKTNQPAGMDEQYNVGGGMTVDDAGCRCPEAGYESTVDPAAKSAADLMVRVGVKGRSAKEGYQYTVLA